MLQVNKRETGVQPPPLLILARCHSVPGGLDYYTLQVELLMTDLNLHATAAAAADILAGDVTLARDSYVHCSCSAWPPHCITHSPFT